MPSSPQPTPIFALTELPPMARFILRGNQAACQAASAALALPIPNPLQATQRPPHAALWLGPDETLILSAEPQTSLQATLTQALTPHAHALTNISHRDIMFQATGTHITQILNAGCPLDLHLSAFPVGMCTRTVLGKTQILLWRTDACIFQLHVWRSFVPYLHDFLMEAKKRL